MRLLGCLLAVPALAACGPSLSSGLGNMTGSLAPATHRATGGLARLIDGSRDLGRVRPNLPVSFLLLLDDPSAPRRAAELAAMYNPRSPHFGHFEAPSQTASEGPTLTAIQRVQSYIRAQGLHAIWHPGDTWLTISGPARRVDRIFGTSVHMYRASGMGTYYASRQDPRVPPAIRKYVADISHLSTAPWERGRTIPAGGLTPSNMQAAYDISPLRAKGMTGSGETVVFFEIDGFRQSDLDAYTRRFNLPSMHPILKSGPQLSPEGEAEMDLEAVHAIAPGARLVVYNLDQQAIANGVRTEAQFEDKLVAYQRKIVTENPHAIVSNSVGGCANVLGRGVANALRTVYDQADALGEAWFAASGDAGAFDCLQNLEQPGDPPAQRDIGVDIPASEPGVTGVGGTRISVTGNGSWQSEVAWEGPVEISGSGGGVSTYFSRPSWQNAPGVKDTHFNPHGMRSVPDVSATADPASSGVYIIRGSRTQEGGTSQAAPIWAGIMALTDQYLRTHGGKRLGFANPALYALARTSPAYPPFHDVTVGSNLVYPAQSGYDMATGLGTPDAWNLARDLLAYETGGTP